MTDSRFGLALALSALASLSLGGCGSESGDGCVPVAEACNGADDDCDGAVDEGFDLGAPCTAGLGACAATGLRVCAGGAAACDAVPGEPSAETCDQVDEDCDGQTDEEVVGCCHPPASTRTCGSDEGACVAGTETCSAEGAWGPCLDAGGEPVVLPDAETCNGIDDDCDGETDEEAVAPGCALQAGVCAAATQACDGASGWICAYPSSYEAEEASCDGLDNDCDGQTDESVADASFGTACDGDDEDLCQEGTIVCGGGVLGCSDVTGANVEVCNGVDDDCDGQTDEEPTDPTVGTACDGSDGDSCQEGTIVCSGGALGCSDDIATKVELCNGIDDDCDGATDESWPDLGTSCTLGIGECARSGQRICKADSTGTECSAVPGTPAAELCNGKDDDCDGATDDGVLLTFYRDADGDTWGTPAITTGACTQPTGYVARAGDCNDAQAAVHPGAAESCNGIDDDCDGQTDEEVASSAPACANQQGVCAGSKAVTCGGAAGWLPCDAAAYSAYSSAYEPSETRCTDGRDNDCDGATDADDPTACTP